MRRHAEELPAWGDKAPPAVEMNNGDVMVEKTMFDDVAKLKSKFELPDNNDVNREFV